MAANVAVRELPPRKDQLGSLHVAEDVGAFPFSTSWACTHLEDAARSTAYLQNLRWMTRDVRLDESPSAFIRASDIRHGAISPLLRSRRPARSGARPLFLGLRRRGDE